MHVKTTEIGVKLWSVIASHTGWPDLFLRTICLMRLHKKLINQNKNQKLATKLLIIEPADVDLVQRRAVDHQKANTPPE